MIVAGRVSQKMAPVLRQVYDQMMEPKWVISMGVCASTGGMFNNYAIVQGVDQVVPVDVYAPGCPPNPETLIHAIVTLHGLILNGEITRRRGETGAGAGVVVEAASSTGPTAVVGRRRSSPQPVTGAPDRHRRSTRPARRPPGLSCCTACRSPRRVASRCSTSSREQYLDLVRTLADDGYVMCVDLSAVDYLTLEADRALPDGVTPERFEVVVNFLDLTAKRAACGCACRSGRRPDAPLAVRHLSGHRGDRARGVRHVRHRVQRSPRPDPDPDARGLGRPPAPQGLQQRAHPGAVQGPAAAR